MFKLTYIPNTQSKETNRFVETQKTDTECSFLTKLEVNIT